MLRFVPNKISQIILLHGYMRVCALTDPVTASYPDLFFPLMLFVSALHPQSPLNGGLESHLSAWVRLKVYKLGYGWSSGAPEHTESGEFIHVIYYPSEHWSHSLSRSWSPCSEHWKSLLQKGKGINSQRGFVAGLKPVLSCMDLFDGVCNENQNFT